MCLLVLLTRVSVQGLRKDPAIWSTPVRTGPDAWTEQLCISLRALVRGSCAGVIERLHRHQDYVLSKVCAAGKHLSRIWSQTAVLSGSSRPDGSRCLDGTVVSVTCCDRTLDRSTLPATSHATKIGSVPTIVHTLSALNSQALLTCLLIHSALIMIALVSARCAGNTVSVLSIARRRRTCVERQLIRGSNSVP